MYAFLTTPKPPLVLIDPVMEFVASVASVVTKGTVAWTAFELIVSLCVVCVDMATVVDAGQYIPFVGLLVKLYDGLDALPVIEYTLPPMYPFKATPSPPETTRAPVAVDDEAVVSVTRTGRDDVISVVDNDNRFTPLVEKAMVFVADSYSPVVVSFPKYMLGAPTDPVMPLIILLNVVVIF